MTNFRQRQIMLRRIIEEKKKHLADDTIFMCVDWMLTYQRNFSEETDSAACDW